VYGGDILADLGVVGGEDFGGGEVGDDAAFGQEDDSGGEVEGLVEVVGDEEGGLVDAGEEVLEHGLHLGSGDGVEGAEGLVHEEDGGVGGEGSGEADALALASGELPGIAAAVLGGVEAGEGEDLGGSGDDLGFGAACEFEGEARVALDGHVGEEAGLLDDIAY
jgi:hypothetical protein